MRFSIRQMEVFRAVMIAGSMNGASSILNISQPAISRTIAHTEQVLSMRLFERRRGKLIPTQEAELLFEHVDRLYAAAMQVNRFAEDLSERPTGTLSICASPQPRPWIYSRRRVRLPQEKSRRVREILDCSFG